MHPAILSQAGIDKGALTTVTCLVAAMATLLIALWANAPLMMAPGMGLNAFSTYTLGLGQGVPWPTALGKFRQCDPFLIAAGAFSLVSLML